MKFRDGRRYVNETAKKNVLCRKDLTRMRQFPDERQKFPFSCNTCELATNLAPAKDLETCQREVLGGMVPNRAKYRGSSSERMDP